MRTRLLDTVIGSGLGEQSHVDGLLHERADSEGIKLQEIEDNG